MAKFLVTGIAGFVGSSLARALLEAGHTVAGIDNLSTGRLENLESIRSSIAFTQADICDPEAMRACVDGADYVLHQAALASVPRSVEDPLRSHESNVEGTLQVLLASRDAKVKRIVYAASSSAYGNQATQPKVEEMCPQPLSPYAVQKLTGEYYLQAFCKVYGMEAVCLRYFNIFGPRQAADSPYSGVIAQFVFKMMAGQVPTINGDGLTSRDFTYIDNAVQANLLACQADSRFASGRVYNVGTGHAQTLNSLYRGLAKAMNFTEEPVYGPFRNGDVQHSLASFNRSCNELGYAPDTDFEQCLLKTVEWYTEEAKTAQQQVLVA